MIDEKYSRYIHIPVSIQQYLFIKNTIGLQVLKNMRRVKIDVQKELNSLLKKG